MPKRTFRWEYMALAALVTLGILVLIYFSYETLGIKKPLLNAVAKDPDVVTASISQEGDKTLVTVQLKNVEDLSGAYKRITDLSQKYVAEDNLVVRVVDKRNENLQKTYLEIHYYLQEAAARGDYGSMIDSTKKILGGSNLSGWKILVDQGRIFVQLRSGDNYLYEIIPALGSKGGVGA